MFASITNYFSNLNDAGQALFIVGILLIITFIILLIVVLKPDRNKIKKIYGESETTDKENIFEEKMKDIDNVSVEDINIDNDKTRNLKHIVDELKYVESKSNNKSVLDEIEKYEDEQEDTAIISVEELLKSNKPLTYAKRESKTYEDNNKRFVETTMEKTYRETQKVIEPIKNDFDDLIVDEEDTKEIKIIGTLDELRKKKEEEKKYIPRKEVFSSVFANDENEEFLNSLKEFRNNL